MVHLEAAVARLRPAMVIINPLTAYLGGTDSYTDADVRGLLGPLAKLAADYDVLVLALMHLNKATQMKALYRLGGSIAFSAAARAVFAVVKDEQSEARRLFVPLKLNLGPTPPALAFSVTAAGLTWESEPVAGVDVEAAMRGPVGTTDEPDAVEEAAEFLRTYLADGPQPSSEVREAAEAHGHAWPTIRRAQRRLGIEPTRMARANGRRGIAGWIWSLPLSSHDEHLNIDHLNRNGILLNGRGVTDEHLDAHDLDAHAARAGRVPLVEAEIGPLDGPDPAPAPDGRGDQMRLRLAAAGWPRLPRRPGVTAGGSEAAWRAWLSRSTLNDLNWLEGALGHDAPREVSRP